MAVTEWSVTGRDGLEDAPFLLTLPVTVHTVTAPGVGRTSIDYSRALTVKSVGYSILYFRCISLFSAGLRKRFHLKNPSASG